MLPSVLIAGTGILAHHFISCDSTSVRVCEETSTDVLDINLLLYG